MKHLIRIAGVGIAVLAAVVGAASIVSAHAEYDHSMPGDGETVATSPANVTISFTLEIQTLPGSYGVAVTNASGSSVTSGNPSVGSDRMSLSIALEPNLPAGTYRVEWNNTAADDGDTLAEGFTFYVGSPPAEMPTAMPMATPMPSHDHSDAGAGHDTTEGVAGATTGLISIPMSAEGGSGVSGHADLFPVDGGMQTQIDVYLNRLAPGSSHMTHVHMNLTCDEAPGAHAADLPNVVADAQGTGLSSSVVDVPFSTIADGSHIILSHAGADASDKTVIACGDIPAQPVPASILPATPSTGSVQLPNTGTLGDRASGSSLWSVVAVTSLMMVGLMAVEAGRRTLAANRNR